jgi:WD40 repeat protein
LLIYVYRIMVVLSNQVQVYDFKKFERIIKLETVENSNGVAAVNSDKNQAIFACHSNVVGEIKVINFDRNNEIRVIHAHKSHVTALALNWQGSLVATASLEGQVVRVFSTSDGKMI